DALRRRHGLPAHDRERPLEPEVERRLAGARAARIALAPLGLGDTLPHRLHVGGDVRWHGLALAIRPRRYRAPIGQSAFESLARSRRRALRQLVEAGSEDLI